MPGGRVDPGASAPPPRPAPADHDPQDGDHRDLGGGDQGARETPVDPAVDEVPGHGDRATTPVAAGVGHRDRYPEHGHGEDYHQGERAGEQPGVVAARTGARPAGHRITHRKSVFPSSCSMRVGSRCTGIPGRLPTLMRKFPRPGWIWSTSPAVQDGGADQDSTSRRSAADSGRTRAIASSSCSEQAPISSTAHRSANPCGLWPDPPVRPARPGRPGCGSETRYRCLCRGLGG